jgi:CspA family cold shock protein
MKGKIKFFQQVKGYGFITTEEGQDVFFHISDFPELKAQVNDKVEFDLKDYKDGKKAIKIRRLK